MIPPLESGMERVRAAAAGLGVFALLFGTFVVIRVLSRLLWAAAWFLETVALLGFAAVFGYLAYRVLWGSSDDPRSVSR